MHKKLSGIKFFLVLTLYFKCVRCHGTALPVDGSLVKKVMVGDKTLEVVSDFCYLEDMLAAGGGCELASIAHYNCA